MLDEDHEEPQRFSISLIPIEPEEPVNPTVKVHTNRDKLRQIMREETHSEVTTS